MIVIAVVLLAAIVLRFGVRGRVPVRLLARALNIPARLGLASGSSALHQRMYRMTEGRLGGWWFGSPILVIETVGRRSRQIRRTPIVYARDGDRFVVTPANAGVEGTPGWWLNLRESGQARITVGRVTHVVRAREAAGSERDRLWRLLLEQSPAIAEYQRFTERPFPVVVLEPGTTPRRR